MNDKLMTTFKNPYVIGGGLLIGVILLAMRGGSAQAAQPDTTIASEQIASATNVALNGQTTDYNKAALAYMTVTANNNALINNAGINANTAIALQSMANMENMNNNQAQIDALRVKGATAIQLNAGNNAAMLDATRITSQTQITLAPIQSALTQAIVGSNNAANVAIAQANAQSRTTIAKIQGKAAQNSSDDSMWGSIVSDVLPIAMAFL